MLKKKKKHKSDFQEEDRLMFCFTSFFQSKLVKQKDINANFARANVAVKRSPPLT